MAMSNILFIGDSWWCSYWNPNSLRGFPVACHVWWHRRVFKHQRWGGITWNHQPPEAMQTANINSNKNSKHMGDIATEQEKNYTTVPFGVHGGETVSERETSLKKLCSHATSGPYCTRHSLGSIFVGSVETKLCQEFMGKRTWFLWARFNNSVAVITRW